MRETQKIKYAGKAGIGFSRIAEPRNIGRKIKKLKINKKACTKCLVCYALCPEAAIKIADAYPVIDYHKCNGCLICLRECPDTAIEEVSD
ncbi:MAG: hypothetical protein B6U68_03090 [Candidatus Aenigmarchaeota archaeon ex4484_14]|nr:MAG: hypothetical protein B6U68_03090 [Candidatus Aenigmarchaeota archaeon ex4484_14]